MTDDHLAVALQHFQADRLAEAHRLCTQILQEKSLAEAWHLLGGIAERQGQIDRAIACYQKTIALKPTYAAAYYNFGNALYKIGQLEAAIAQYQQAIAIDRNFAEAYNSWGFIQQERGELTEAISLHQTALKIKPQFPEAAYNLGKSFSKQHRLNHAIAAYRHAISLNPHYSDPYVNLGVILRHRGQLDEAIACYQKALKLQPKSAAIYTNLGNVLQEKGQLKEAIFHHQAAISLEPQCPEAHHNLSNTLLLAGELQRGFAEYEWRLQLPQIEHPPAFPQPAWDGFFLHGKTILLYAEQGLGDTIQFVRYAPLVKEKGGNVILRCPASLRQLLETVEGIDRLICPGDSLPMFETHASLMSLPYLLQTTLETIPCKSPYLSVPIEITSSLQIDNFTSKPQPSTSNLKVGLVWAGNPSHPNDRHRSTTLSQLLKLLEVPNITFYGLQKVLSVEDYQILKNTPIINLSDRLTNFAATAAIVSQLDLVVTVDTAVAHLAGALGKPVWILLAYIPDWRWMLQREDSPWYPTARLFRQQKRGDWKSAIDLVVAALSTYASLKTQITSPLTPIIFNCEEGKNILKSTQKNTPVSESQIALTWSPNPVTGWGVYGTNFAIKLLENPYCEPVFLLPPTHLEWMNPLHRWHFYQLWQKQQSLRQRSHFNFPVVRALGNQFATDENSDRFRGQPQIGAIFFEDTALTPAALEKAKTFDRIIAGSTWNAQILQHYGLPISTVFQGIDRRLFFPAPKSKLFGNRFVIFSGGKLEYRKGQDLVIAAFRAFYQRHPDALLIAAWHNFWTDYLAGLEKSPYITGLPKIRQDRSLAISEWLANHGIPPEAAIDLGAVPHYLMPQILREADVALFPNRAEGGTNLVAMECMASGIPTILSANTGHLDLIGGDRCFSLKTQRNVQPVPPFGGVEGWGESDIDEIVETLEWVYQNRELAREKGRSAVQFMGNWTWRKQVDRWLKILKLME
ncbi:MAG TPA: tetratricopeptide repeat protein [Oscillatoriales cyanobacterium M4454_W2019_049]|nr:tetratricopeptide repeat protein [Oscillatoriales cyanobacterium M4454_W2019_049]